MFNYEEAKFMWTNLHIIHCNSSTSMVIGVEKEMKNKRKKKATELKDKTKWNNELYAN